MTRIRPTDPSAPHISPKQLHRFYEPLGLLHALGKVRGEHTSKSLPSFAETDSFTTFELRRQFLNELAFVCDHKKGGDTVTAIGLEQTPQGYVFWVAANECPEKLIVPFLKNLLGRLKESEEERGDCDLTGDIFRMIVSFAHSRIRTYGRKLLSTLNRMRDFPVCTGARISAAITDWVVTLGRLMEADLHSLVGFAYANRHSDFIHQLTEFAREPLYRTTDDSLQATCASARHIIGRLGLHARSAKALAQYAPRMITLLGCFSVQAIPIPTKGIGRPSSRKATTLKDALKRMLPANARDLERYQQALAEMDEPFRLSERLLEAYDSSKFKTRVHAETQVLDHFDEHDREFAGDDKYIACSKPACFCCRLYFRYHPGGFVEPRSHQKIYLNWQPPGLSNVKAGREYQLRDILNRMIEDIRADALNQIIEKMGPRNLHPDSVTGISFSVSAGPEFDAMSTTANGEVASSSSDNSGFGSDNGAAPSSSIISFDADSDEDQEDGGVSLLGT